MKIEEFLLQFFFKQNSFPFSNTVENIQLYINDLSKLETFFEKALVFATDNNESDCVISFLRKQLFELYSINTSLINKLNILVNNECKNNVSNNSNFCPLENDSSNDQMYKSDELGKIFDIDSFSHNNQDSFAILNKEQIKPRKKYDNQISKIKFDNSCVFPEKNYNYDINFKDTKKTKLKKTELIDVFSNLNSYNDKSKKNKISLKEKRKKKKKKKKKEKKKKLPKFSYNEKKISDQNSDSLIFNKKSNKYDSVKTNILQQDINIENKNVKKNVFNRKNKKNIN